MGQFYFGDPAQRWVRIKSALTNAVIEQLAKILKLSPDILYFYAKRLPGDIEHNVDEERIIAAYRAWRAALDAPANVRA